MAFQGCDSDEEDEDSGYENISKSLQKEETKSHNSSNSNNYIAQHMESMNYKSTGPIMNFALDEISEEEADSPIEKEIEATEDN